jgi:hypothetical protein
VRVVKNSCLLLPKLLVVGRKPFAAPPAMAAYCSARDRRQYPRSDELRPCDQGRWLVADSVLMQIAPMLAR